MASNYVRRQRGVSSAIATTCHNLAIFVPSLQSIATNIDCLLRVSLRAQVES